MRHMFLSASVAQMLNTLGEPLFVLSYQTKQKKTEEKQVDSNR